MRDFRIINYLNVLQLTTIEVIALQMILESLICTIGIANTGLNINISYAKVY